MKPIIIIVAILALAIILILAGCTSSQTITDLQLAVDAVAVALPLIAPAAGLPASLVTQIDTYLAATSQAIAQASDILAGTGTDAQKAAGIAAAFAGIAAPLVPGQYAGIAAAVEAVAADVAKFLASEPTTQALARDGAAAVHVSTLSKGDREKLISIKAKALTLAIAAKKQ